MDPSLIGSIKDWGIGTLAVVAFAYILYVFISKAFKVLADMQSEHKSDQDWFKQFVNENNHQKTELITRVSDNIAKSTSAMDSHTKALERLLDKLN